MFDNVRHRRRKTLSLLHFNGALWSIGNGLTTGTLVVYLAIDLGASGAAIGYILAAPTLVSLLRLATPWLIERAGSAKKLCIIAFVAGYCLLLGLPAIAVAHVLDDGQTRGPWLALLVTLLCAHQLLENVASVGLYSWINDLVPRRIRGRVLARRQCWQLVGLIPTLWASGYFADWWKQSHPDSALLAYAIPMTIGAVVLLFSIAPLLLLPATRPMASVISNQASFWTPLGDGRFRWLLLFGCWFSFFNGVTQSAQSIYPYEVLKLGVFDLALMRTLMHVGQLANSLWVGRFADRYGNRPLLMLSQLAVSLGPIFFLLATPQDAYWLYGAWLVWSLYAGMNVGLPNLCLKLGGANAGGACIAMYFAITGVCYAVSTVAGGFLLDEARTLSAGGSMIGAFHTLFIVGGVCRAAAIVWLLPLRKTGER